MAEPPEEEDGNADALRAFNHDLMEHPELQSLVLPLGDGLGIVAKVPRRRNLEPS